MRLHRRSADLAAVVARSAATGASAVRFDVAHVLPTGTPIAPVEGETPHAVAAHRVREALLTEAAGIGLRIRTWIPRLPEEPPDDVAVTAVRAVPGPPGSDLVADLPATGAHPAPVGHEFAGHCPVNPSFLYDRTRIVELLLTIDAEGWHPDLGDCLMTGRVAEEIAAAAAAVGRPVLLMQCPAAPHHDAPPSYRKDGSGEAPRRAQGLAVRAAIGVDDGRPDERLSMVARIGAFAGRYGIGLQCSDTRLGRVTGEWWTVFQPRPKLYRQAKARLAAGAEPGTVPSEVRVATFVGPARVGSTSAILAELAGRQVGMLSVLVSALQEITFVHAVLPVAPARAEPGRATAASVDDDLAQGLGRLASACGLTIRSKVPDRRGADLTAAVDHVVVESGPVALPNVSGVAPQTLKVRESTSITSDAVEYPLWISWSVPAATDAAPGTVDPLSLVIEQVEKATEVAGARVLYARVRRASGGRWRGRAKLAASLAGAFDPEAVPAVLGTVCSAAQGAVRTRCGLLGLDVGEVEIRVAWRERWLGAR